jgi:hypothetical protein
MFDEHPHAFVCDIENAAHQKGMLKADLCHHVGVFYHLVKPVEHLYFLSDIIQKGIMLDTHYAGDDETDSTYTAFGKEYRYKRHLEGGRREAFSGMYDHAKWLRLGDITALLNKVGFNNIEVAELRNERNGKRALIFASK